MMSISEDTSNSQSAVEGVNVKSSLPSEENPRRAHQDTNGQADVTPNGTIKTTNGHGLSPAWLSMEHNQGPTKVKLPPVTVPGNKKRKPKRVTNKTPRQSSKGKLHVNTSIEPLQEETTESNVKT